MRRALVFCVITSILTSLNIRANDEIEFEADPVVTVEIAKPQNTSTSYIPWVVGTGVFGVTIAAAWIFLKR